MITVLLATLALFDGQALDGWASLGDADWSIEAGVLTGVGAGQGFLLTDREYGDFHLRLEFWIDRSTNSGLFIRCLERNRIAPDSCYEVNIWDEHPRPEARTGAIVLEAMPPLAHVDTVNRWNVMEVSADGRHIVVFINGEQTARLDNAEARQGFIALQHWGTGVVKFRSLTLTFLEK